MLAGLLMATAAAHAAPAHPKAPKVASPEQIADQERLLVPTGSRDLSAYRLDTEVFGWNSDFTEVGALVMEVARGPQGRHRGETYMLVYRIGQWLPKHNIITHNITHADFPDRPLPLQEAKEFLWNIEASYQGMWPRRPRRHWANGDIRITPVWAPMPGTGSGGTPACQPWVSLQMKRGRVAKMMPFVPVDMAANCQLLRMTDARTYWGTPNIAASMVRFDFSSQPHNEESARFLLSGAWHLGRAPKVSLVVPPALRRSATVAKLVRLLGAYAPVAVRPGDDEGAPSDDAFVADVQASHDWLPLGIGALIDAGVAIGHAQPTDGSLSAPPEGPAAAKPRPLPAPRGPRTTPQGGPMATRGGYAAQAQAHARAPRFGFDAGAGEGASFFAPLPKAMAGESGMVNDITDQHDPIEDAFPDGPEGPTLWPRPPPRPKRLNAVRDARSAPAPSAPRARPRPAPIGRDEVRITLRARRAAGSALPAVDAAANPAAPSAAPAHSPAPAGQYIGDWAP